MSPFTAGMGRSGEDKTIPQVSGGAGIQTTTFWLWEPLPSKGTPGLPLLSFFDQMRLVTKDAPQVVEYLSSVCAASVCLPAPRKWHAWNPELGKKFKIILSYTESLRPNTQTNSLSRSLQKQPFPRDREHNCAFSAIFSPALSKRRVRT